MSKIFLAEDDPYIMRVYERAFRLRGHEIQIVPDGESAWSALSTMSTLPDAIVLDIMLPKMSGTDLLMMVNQDKRLDSIPVAVLTNSFDEDIEKKVVGMGADLYLVKIDHEPKDVVAEVENLIRNEK